MFVRGNKKGAAPCIEGPRRLNVYISSVANPAGKMGHAGTNYFVNGMNRLAGIWRQTGIDRNWSAAATATRRRFASWLRRLPRILRRLRGPDLRVLLKLHDLRNLPLSSSCC